MTAKPKDEGEHTASGIAQHPSKDAAIAVSHADLADLIAAVEAERLDDAKTIAARFKL